jgi:hypothetical protein
MTQSTEIKNNMKKEYKYIVSVTTINFDANRNPSTQSFYYTFENGDLPTMRSEALDKANDITYFFENEMPSGHEFDSGIEAELKGYKNTNGYCIDIFFFIDDDDYQIKGDDDAKDESLEVEQIEFEKMGFEYDIVY